MATGYREAERLRDGVDWSVPHRQPPPVPHPHSPSAAPYQQHHSFSTVAEGNRAVVGGYSGHPPDQTSNSAATRERGPFSFDEAASLDSRSQSQSHTGRRRGSSFSSLLKRSTSNSSQQNVTNGVYTAGASAPPLPKTRIAQAHSEAAARKEQGKQRQDSNGSTRSFTMLRKSSKLKAQQAEQQRREASLPREPPHLPSLNPLPGIATFGGEDARPDSVAIFNNAYTHSQPSATNFSRPSAMAPSSSFTSSSSPAYAARGANGIPRDSTSPPDSKATKTNGEYVANPSTDRTESMTNRGRYSYASSTVNVNSINSPRRVRRRKDPTPFNVLVIGAKNSGKTSFISLLRHSLALPSHKKPSDQQPEQQVAGNRGSFTSQYLETDMDGERIGLTLWDSAGLEKNIVDLQLREITAFVEAKFEDTFVEEQKVMRSPGVKDTHIHCVFLILDPVRLDSTINASTAFKKNGSHTGSLDDDLDLQVMRALWGKTTVIPVVSKADTLTIGHMAFLKRAVWEALRVAKLDPLEALELEDDGEDDEEDEDEEANGEDSDEGEELPVPKTRRSHKRQSSLSAISSAPTDDGEPPYIPMSIISPDLYDLPPYAPKSKSSKQEKIGRRFPWGFADPYDPNHCDFGRLRDSIFSEWRSELRELSRTKWYENWRTSRLKNLPNARQRIKGGVTPVGAVPGQGRIASQNSRQFSPPTAPSQSTLGASIPRSVSTTSQLTAATGVGARGDQRDFSGGSVRY